MIRKNIDYTPLRDYYDERDKNRSRLLKPGQIIELDDNVNYEIVPEYVELHEAQDGYAGKVLVGHKIIRPEKLITLNVPLSMGKTESNMPYFR